MSTLLDKAKQRREAILELTQAQVGKSRVGFGNDERLVKETVPIGYPDIDEMLGGGLRKGRIAMVVGQESMGKTLFTQWVIRAFQERGEICGFIDPEKTFDPDWFDKTGVNIDELLVVQPASTEQAFDLATVWATNGVGLIVIDSLAALTPQSRVNDDLTSQEFMGLMPRKISEGLNRFTNLNTDALMVCTNQLRSKIGVVYGSPDEIPGGRAQRFYASYILKIKRKGWIKEGDTRVGYNLVVETLKNKLAPPHQEATVPFMFSGIVDTLKGTITLALDLGLIEKSGAYYSWGEERIRGRNKLEDWFRDNPDSLDILLSQIEQGNEGTQFD